eukprot:jgi/Bigna1/77149/fgenesh1_pg.46_\
MALNRVESHDEEEPPLVVSNVYVSDHSKKVLDYMGEHVGDDSFVVSTFTDVEYNRASMCISGTPTAVVNSVVKVVAAALEKPDIDEQPLYSSITCVSWHQVDYSEHSGTHPAIGAVDHVNVHPLRPSKDLKIAVEVAESIAERLASDLKIPVYLYGAAHPQGKGLAKGRRELGELRLGAEISAQIHFKRRYFTSHKSQTLKKKAELKVIPDAGPRTNDPKKGVAMVGACPWVVNYNVPVACTTYTNTTAAISTQQPRCQRNHAATNQREIHGESLSQAQVLCDQIREAKGGLKGVQAMALKNENGIEVACNLLEIEEIGPEDVYQKLRAECEKLDGVEIKSPYVIGRFPKDVLSETLAALRENE